MSQSQTASGYGQEIAAHIRQVITQPPSETLRALLSSSDEWVVSLETAHLLASLVEYVKPHSVLEFGAGRSSLVIASALATSGRTTQLTSIEHQPEYSQQAWRRMAEFPSVDAHLQEARLGLHLSRYGLLHAYSGIHGALARRGPFDFVFIDAPPGNLGRDSTLFSAAPFLTTGAIVVLDDARRAAEKTAVRRWMRALDVEVIFDSDAIGRGVVVLAIGQPHVADMSWRTFVGTLDDRIQEWRWQRRLRK